MKPNFQVFFYAALSAALFAFAIPNEMLAFGSPFLGLFALVPLYHAFTLVQSPRDAFLCGAIQLSLLHLLSSFWLSSFKDYAAITLGLTTLCYFVSGGIIAFALYTPFAYTRNGTHRLQELAGTARFSSAERILWFTVVWTLHEWGKSTGFLAYPWGTLIQTAWRWKLVTQIVSLTGTWGLSFLFALFSATVAEALELLPYTRRSPSLARAAAFCVILFAAAVLYGTVTYTKEYTPVATMDTVLVQQNGDSWTDDANMLISRSQDLTTAAIETANAQGNFTGKPDLVVWSETVLNYLMPDYWEWYNRHPSKYPLQQSIKDTGVPYIIGAPWVYDREKGQYENAAVLFDKYATIVKHHGKIHLVPFAEAIPYSDEPWMQHLMEAVAGFSSSWSSGKEYTIFDIPVKDGGTVQISTPICFEDAFPDVCRQLYLEGSRVFVNITNDSWSLKKSSEIQHFVMASYRAQEYRTTLVRSTNGGYTTVVDPTGRILADLPLFEAASTRVSVPVYEEPLTPYALLGDWFPLVCFILSILLLTLLIVEWRQTSGKKV